MEKVIPAVNLTSGRAQSCGCSTRELRSNKLRRHGMTRSREHTIWIGIHQRCGNPNNSAFPRYGGRGIHVCERWRVFDNFLVDMGQAPEGMTLERKDNDGPYSPENCRWATKTEQNRNKRTNVVVTHEGVSMTLSELAQKVDQPYGRIQGRHIRGCTGEALTGPKRVNQWG